MATVTYEAHNYMHGAVRTVNLGYIPDTSCLDLLFEMLCHTIDITYVIKGSRR